MRLYSEGDSSRVVQSQLVLLDCTHQRSTDRASGPWLVEAVCDLIAHVEHNIVALFEERVRLCRDAKQVEQLAVC